MKVLLRSIALPLLAMALALSPAVAGGAPAPAPSIEEIRREADASRRRLQSLYVEAITRGKIAGNPAGPPLETRHVLAAKGPLRFVELAHRTPLLDWSEDVGYTRSYFTGATFGAFYVLNRYYETLRLAPGEFSSTKVRAGRKLLPGDRVSGEAPAGPPPILAWALAASALLALVLMGNRRPSWIARAAPASARP